MNRDTQAKLGPPRSTRLRDDDDNYLAARCRRAGLPPAFFLRSWAEKCIALERARERRKSRRRPS